MDARPRPHRFSLTSLPVIALLAPAVGAMSFVAGFPPLVAGCVALATAVVVYWAFATEP